MNQGPTEVNLILGGVMRMMMLGLVLAVALGLAGQAMASAEAGDFCGGVKIGTISGFTGKLWITLDKAMEVTVGSWDLGNVVV